MANLVVSVGWFAITGSALCAAPRSQDSRILRYNRYTVNLHISCTCWHFSSAPPILTECEVGELLAKRFHLFLLIELQYLRASKQLHIKYDPCKMKRETCLRLTLSIHHAASSQIIDRVSTQAWLLDDDSRIQRRFFAARTAGFDPRIMTQPLKNLLQ